MTGWIVCTLLIAIPGWILGHWIHHHSPATTNGDGAPSCKETPDA
ncbi:hypothetical protein [Brachybacterium alimentarium]|nr:hypothetical protein [Brachybacterium alimentarium]